MVIESLKAAQTALKEAMKDKDMSEATKKKLGETDAALQKLLDKAREAAKQAKAKEAEGEGKGKEEEEESGEAGDEEESKGKEMDMPEEGHTVTVTHKVKHDGPADDGEDDEDEDSEESKRGYIQSLLKEAGIPKELWSLDKLAKLSLKEAKEAIEEKKALIEAARKGMSRDVEMIDLSGGEPLHESIDGDKGNLNGLFTGCAQ